MINKSAIICVDDERDVLASLRQELEEVFGDEYQIEIASDAKECLEIYDELEEDEYKIPVVISDYIMPGMKGDELFKILHEKNSRTFKIMLTGQADAIGIANALNYGNLYRVITKPWKFDELIFTVKEAIKNYKKNEFIEKQHFELKRNKELSDALKKYNFKFNKIIEENKRIFNFILPSLINISTVFERNYFIGHTKFIIGLSLRLAEELEFNNESRISIVLSTLLLHQIMQNMPEKFIGVDPNSLKNNESKEFFSLFNTEIDKLSQNEYLNKYVLILTKIWEHYDGTGLPHGLTFNQLSKATQIINLAIVYHIGVYKISDDDLKILEKDGEVSQPPEESSKRHALTMQYIFKNSSWYDLDIMNVFQRLVKSKTCPELIPDKHLIKIYASGDEIRIMKYSAEEFHYDENKKIIIPIEKLMANLKKKKPQDKKELKRALETKLTISELHAGMIAGADIITKYGRLIVAKDTTLSKDDIEEIVKIKRHGLFTDQDEFVVYIPREV